MKRSDLISMTAKELSRLEAMQQLQSGQATQAQIARRLQISIRQVKRAYHPPRARRERFGELIQIDGSPHNWFEERGPRCTLLVFIDDATSAIVAARFVKAETTNAYFTVAYEYFQRYGRPETFYSDRYSVFRINRDRQAYRTQPTQFARAMDELGIELICANSPQAKGRVERANRTLQDRLVKELRLASINDIDAGNAFLPAYLADHNWRFARQALNPADAHTTIRTDQHLERILACRYPRTLSKDLTVQHGSRLYQIINPARRLAFPKAAVHLIECLDGAVLIERQGVALEYTTLERPKQPAIRSGKELEPPAFRGGPNPKKAHKPSSTHPWHTGYDPVRLAQVRATRGHF